MLDFLHKILSRKTLPWGVQGHRGAARHFSLDLGSLSGFQAFKQNPDICANIPICLFADCYYVSNFCLLNIKLQPWISIYCQISRTFCDQEGRGNCNTIRLIIRCKEGRNQSIWHVDTFLASSKQNQTCAHQPDWQQTPGWQLEAICSFLGGQNQSLLPVGLARDFTK